VVYWLFQGNPKYYRLLEAIRDFEQMPWLVTRYAKEITAGNGVLIWKAGDKAGIYATAKIIEPPSFLEKQPDLNYWLDKSRLGSKPQAIIQFTHKWLDRPLLREDLKQDPLLKDLSVIRQPNATNYKIAPQQWQRVQECQQ
jgi:EVE domain